MTDVLRPALIALALALAGPAGGQANEFTVSPTSLAVPAGGQVAVLTVRSSTASMGQVRVMRWLRGSDDAKLLPTRDVIASPPALHMAAGQETTIRLVRVINAPINGLECYRVLIDQLPAAGPRGQSVAFTLRHSVPLCFGGDG